ncbi:MAG: molybdopterin-dependent oxidoreductase [Burkholderiales bacterium]|nr:molybdopterin-dependent oxidoreductase [Burkholderiales bacterium]
MTIDRRRFLATAAGVAVAGPALAAPGPGPAGLPAGALESAAWDTLPGKQPLIKRSWRPPNFETPTRYFGEAFTPNDAFFVRYHLSNIPQVDAAGWAVEVGGDAVEKPVRFTLDELKTGFENVEIAALCQCSGNRRGLSDPHVAGVQWGYGAMGNAKWKGARLKDVLAKAGIKAGALEVAFDGADGGVSEKTPDFVKSIPVWKALDENVLIAWEMNGEPLPHWNGFPARIVVPGWTATYWMKHLTSIQVLSQPFKGFWMNPAYRIPKGKFPVVDRFLSQETDANTPITEMVVNSLVTNLREGMTYKANSPLFVRGIAWDGGYGIARVEVSRDGGKTWELAELGPDLGRFSWRQWSFAFVPKPGEYVVMAKATNRIGATQTFDLVFNPAGYHNNVVQRIPIVCA